MNVSSNAPPHSRARPRRPIFIRTTAADRTARHFGLFRSSCGHVIGFAVVWRGRQWSISWAACR